MKLRIKEIVLKKLQCIPEKFQFIWLSVFFAKKMFSSYKTPAYYYLLVYHIIYLLWKDEFE